MKMEKSNKQVIYDERQQQIQLKSYSLSFWFVMFILYFATFGRLICCLISLFGEDLFLIFATVL